MYMLNVYAYQCNVFEFNAEVYRIDMLGNSTGTDTNVQLTQVDWNG